VTNANATNYIAVVGPTASGKTSMGYELAHAIGGEIVCLDSVQLYKGFDIGSAKPTRVERTQCPHHLFDAFEWSEPCDAALYAARARLCIQEIRSRRKWPVLVGGTGLYLRAVQGHNWDEGLPKDDELRHELSTVNNESLMQELQAKDPLRASQLHVNDKFRLIRAVEINRLTGRPVPQPSKAMREDDGMVIVLNPERSMLHQRIDVRVKEMLKAGLISEVQGLCDKGVDLTCKPMQSIGYLQVGEYLSGKITEVALEPLIAAATRQYAKRQSTWFNKVDRYLTIEHDVKPEDWLDSVKKGIHA
jgi:tRNA dimethylallyltransferase